MTGQKGERGEQGFDGQRGERGSDGLPGLNGQKGEPGLVITKTEGESYSFSEVQIRDICSKLLQGLYSRLTREYSIKIHEMMRFFLGFAEELAKLIPTLIGPVGPAGKLMFCRSRMIKSNSEIN